MSAPAASSSSAAPASVRLPDLMIGALADTLTRERAMHRAYLARSNQVDDADLDDEENFDYDDTSVYEDAMEEMGGEMNLDDDDVRTEFYLLSYTTYARKYHSLAVAADRVFVRWCALADLCFHVHHDSRLGSPLADRVKALVEGLCDLVAILDASSFDAFDVSDIPGLLLGREHSRAFDGMWPAVRAVVSRATDTEFAALVECLQSVDSETNRVTLEMLRRAKARPEVAERAALVRANLAPGLQTVYGLPPELSDIIARFATAGVTDANPLPERIARQQRLAELAAQATTMADADMANALKRMLAEVERDVASDAKRRKH
ncbi:MAG: hypothetical protein Q7V62_16925 [Actinomycetota bacterium]|nr:hypothetical protein [Actinomycetota bacterium]